MSRQKKRVEARRVIFVLLFGLISLFTACSYITDFVVVNESANSIQVRYRVKSLPGTFAPRITPATMTISQLRAGDRSWSDLTATRYTLEPKDREVVVSVMPNEALRVERIQRAGMQVDESEEASVFSIEEITIVGANNEIKLQGEQVRKGFVPESKKLYSLIYR